MWSKTSRHARGYGTAWDKLRLQILERDHYVCQLAKAEGRIEPASEVDHVISKEAWKRTYGTLNGVDNPSNLQSVGHERHKAKTMLEKGHTPKPPRKPFGPDGWPGG